MSLIISYRTAFGAVMAADSRLSWTDNGHYRDTTQKLFVSENGVGISTCGDAFIDGTSISLYIEKYLKETNSKTVTEIANGIIPYFYSLKSDLDATFHIVGYEKDTEGKNKLKLFRAFTQDKEKVVEFLYKAMWNGNTYVTNLLFNQQYWKDGDEYKTQPLYTPFWGNASLQDAIDFERFCIETTAKHMELTCCHKTVGGPIDILVIKPDHHEWISKKELI